MSPKAAIPIKRKSCCAGQQCNRGRYVRSDTGGVQHAWQDGVFCPCVPQSGRARKRRRSEALTDIKKRTVQSDEDSQQAKECEAGEQQKAEDDQPEVGNFRTARLEAGWTPVGQVASSQNFKALYAADHSRVTGQAKAKLNVLAQVWSCQSRARSYGSPIAYSSA